MFILSVVGGILQANRLRKEGSYCLCAGNRNLKILCLGRSEILNVESVTRQNS